MKHDIRIRDVRLPASAVRAFQHMPHKHVLFIEETSRGYIRNRAYYKLRCVRCWDAFMVEVDYPSRPR